MTQNRKVSILMGVGNQLRGDDGIGPYIAQNLNHPDWISLDCGTAPENFTSVVRRKSPQYLAIIDAAQMGISPGAYRLLPKSSTDLMYVSTHSIPLSALFSYLEKYSQKSLFIGVQPEKIHQSQHLTEPLLQAGSELIDILKEKDFDRIPQYDKRSD